MDSSLMAVDQEHSVIDVSTRQGGVHAGMI